MTARRRTAGLAVLACLALSASGCAAFKQVAASSPSPSPTPSQTRMTNLVGKGLAYAIDQAHTAGFTGVTSYDASGKARTQILDRDWKVCFQTPRAGAASTTAKVTLAVMKLAESCPSTDQGAAPSSLNVMPNFAGKSAKYAAQVLGENSSITYKDKTGADALVFVETNWEVCSQTPAAGKPYGGVPVTLVVAQYADGGCAGKK